MGPNVSGEWKVGDRVGGYLFRKACGTCADCKWYASAHDGQFSAQYCANRIMTGISGANGGFAQYMMSPDYALLKLPDNLPFEQAAPLLCAGATIWNAIARQQYTKAKPWQLLALAALVSSVSSLLRPWATASLPYTTEMLVPRWKKSLKTRDPTSLSTTPNRMLSKSIAEFTDGISLDAAVVCTENIPADDWILHQLHPRGTCVVLGLPEEGFTFDAFNLVFREIVVKGSLHSSIDRMRNMLEVVTKYNIRSNISLVPLDEAEDLLERAHNHEISGRAVVTMQ